MPLDTFQEEILAHALNEGLRERDRACAGPALRDLSWPGWTDDRLAALVDEVPGLCWWTRHPDQRPPSPKE